MSVGRGLAGGGIGIVVIALIAMFLGIDPSLILQGGMSAGGPAPGAAAARSRRKRLPATTRWPTSSPPCSAAPRKSGPTSSRAAARRYQQAHARALQRAGAVRVRLRAGGGRAVLLPRDKKLYIDLAFYRDLRTSSRRRGDFAQAYVIAHEVGHHVQNLLGIAEQVQAHTVARRGSGKRTRSRCGWSCRPTASPGSGRRQANRASAGSSSRATSRRASAPPRRSATTASRWPRAAMCRRSPSRTGQCQQRVRWFRRGLDTGDMKVCDVFRRRRSSRARAVHRGFTTTIRSSGSRRTSPARTSPRPGSPAGRTRRVVEPHACTRRVICPWARTVVGAEGLERALLEGRPHPALPLLALREERESRPRPVPRIAAPAGIGSLDHDPGHVRLRLDLEAHAQRRRRGVHSPFGLLLDRRHRAPDRVAGGERLP